MKLFYTVLFYFALFFAPFFGNAQNAAPLFTVEKDICYKIAPNNDSLKLDLFLPRQQNYKSLPLVFHIHGGAWVKGDKNFEKQYYTKHLRDSLLAKGYGFISINYRLLNDSTHFDQQVDDVYAALDWLKNNANRYRIDLGNVGIMGESAGAHLALLMAYSDLKPKAVKFNYMLDVFGPTNLNTLLRTEAGWLTRSLFSIVKPDIYKLRNKLIYFMTAADIKQEKQQVMESLSKYSPIRYVDDNDVATPMLILHGDNDNIVPFQQSVDLQHELQKRGAAVSLVEVKEGNHGFTTTSPERLNELVNQSLQFIELYYKP
jgi:triacylglycerol lipase